MSASRIAAAIAALRTGLNELNPVTGPERLPSVDVGSAWRWISIGVLIALSATVLLVRRRRSTPAATTNDDLADRLERLHADRNGRREFPERLSALVREHLARRHAIAAESMTTAELAEQLGHPADGRRNVHGWVAILSRCDRAKFAGQALTGDESAEALRTAQTLLAEDLIVSETLPPKKFGDPRQNGSSAGESNADGTPAAGRAH